MTKDTTDKGLFSRYGGGRYGYPHSYGCTPCPPGGGYGYPPAGYPPPAEYPPAAYPYTAHTHHSGYVSSHTLVGGAAAAYGMQHHAGGHHSAHKHHGYGQHSKFKHGKFGGRWKHGTAQVKFNKWK